MVRVECYGRRGGRYNGRAIRVDLGNVTIWFSYTTPIAFQKGNGPIVARANDWGHTTGRHLDYVGVDREDRVDGEEFVELLNKALRD